MKKFIYPISFFLTISVSLLAQDQKTNGMIQQPVIHLFEGVSRFDDELMRAQVTDDFILLEDMKVWTIDSLINVVKPQKNSGTKRINTFFFKRTEYQGDMAWVVYENTASITTSDKSLRTVRWLESAVLVRQVYGK